MSERDFRSLSNLLAVSANTKQPALGTYATLDTTLTLSEDDIIDLEPRTEDNTDQMTGMEEPDTVYRLGATSSGTLNFSKAEAQHFAFAYSFGLGLSTPSAWGATGKKHAMSPTSEVGLPAFTLAQRFGSTVEKRRYGDMFMDQVTATFQKDAFAKLVCGVKGTGRYESNVTTELVTAAYNATSITLASVGVQGSTAAARLSNVQAIRALNPATGEYTEVAYSAVSGAVPAVITITAPGAVATSTTYEILYIPVEAAWATFPARVIESPIRINDLVVKVGGKWNGTTFLGGRTFTVEVESIEHSLNNAMKIEFRAGGTGQYANYAVRTPRVQALKFDRQMREAILQRKITDGEYFGVEIIATGAAFATGYNFYVDLVFPRCAVLKSPMKVTDKFMAETGDLKVLQDSTYGSVMATVGNQIAGYAQ
jgi:hypothetical protein